MAYEKLPIIIVLGILLALAPFILGIVDNILYKTVVQEESWGEIEASSGAIVLKSSASSSLDSDTLVVSPASIWVPQGGNFTLEIKVYFKHSQPCPYSDWKALYNYTSGVEVISDDGGALVDSKTYVRHVVFRVLGNATITVIYKYGSGCPEGTEEKVEVTVYTGGEAPQQTLSTPTQTTTEASIEEREYMEIEGNITSIDTSRATITVNGITLYIRGSGAIGIERLRKKMYYQYLV